MHSPNIQEIYNATLAGGGVMMLLASVIVFLILNYQRRYFKFNREKQSIKFNFEQTLLQSQLEIQEQTLRNISHEIHDNIGQILSLVSLNLNLLSCNNPDRLTQTEELVNKAITDLRDLSKSLNPERVQQIGLKEAIEHELQHLERTDRFLTSFIINKYLEPLSPEKTIILYRMIQETLNNIMKHAVATTIKVEMDSYSISITDNGKGFDTSNEQLNGIGLQNIQSRAKLINANAQIISKINKGTTVIFTIKQEENV